MKTLCSTIRDYMKWRNNWDDLCDKCGLCCYARFVSLTGKVTIKFSEPCEFLDEKTHLCSVFENRFHKCSTCGSVNILQALFNPSLPPSCAYSKTFRKWRKVDNDDGY